MNNKEILISIFMKYLPDSEILLDKNIFDLGGSSLTIYQISKELHQNYNIIIEPGDIMTYPTINEMLNFLNNDVVENNSLKLDKNLIRRKRRGKKRGAEIE